MTRRMQDSGPRRPSMLVKFSGENVRSLRDPFEISLVATSIAEKEFVRTIPWREGDTATSTVGVLPVAGFFGANASGKSNILRALNDMRTIILQSFRAWSKDDRTQRAPFRLDRVSQDKHSRFEVQVILDGVLHHYGFTLDDKTILTEWAFRLPKGRIQRIFERNGLDIEYGSSVSAVTVQAGELVRPNALLLSTVVAFRGSELSELYDWFGRNMPLAEASNRSSRQVFTAKQLEDPARRARTLRLLRAADLGVVDLEEVDFEGLPEEIRQKVEKVLEILNEGSEHAVTLGEADNLVNLVHRGADDMQVRFAIDDESLGTAVWLGLAGPVIDALDEGSVLLADELDSSLHPVLVEQLIRLFQDPETNPNRAQLLFNSHDAHLLGDSINDRSLGRDQIWFTEKGHDGSSTVYSLADQNPRRQEAIARRYLQGRYGAVPIVSFGDFADAVRLDESERAEHLDRPELVK